MKQAISPEQLLALAHAAIREAPAFDYDGRYGEAEQKWLGRVAALLEAAGSLVLLTSFRLARANLQSYSHSRTELLQPLYDLMSQLELRLPAELQGAFIAAGDTWNGYAALVRIMQREADDLLIVDPYVSGGVFTDLVPHIVASRSVRILTAAQPKLQPALLASSQKWNTTPNRSTPEVETRLAPDGSLHDRLIILDGEEVWLVSQSLKDIGKRSAASLTRADPELASMKSDAYDVLWKQSQPLV
ncbi:hypothetical protein [Tabrizicola sp.]|uniref:hypothetical protein n=1 Tax=Tabrizicola sp. TaxID=2005166 RepID=UPI0035B1D935